MRVLIQLEGVAEVLEACDAAEARRRLADDRPDVLFLDIQMPGGSGMALAASLAPPMPQLVFTTAFDAYAVAAFDTGAADYLLKPFDGARLQRALARVRTRLAAPAQALPQAQMQAQMQAMQQPAHLLVPGRGGTAVVPVADIGWIETADNYVILHTRDAQPLLRRTMAALLAELGPGFVRCHRRAAVQVGWIERVLARPHGDCALQLRGGALVPCSRQYRAAVMAALG